MQFSDLVRDQNGWETRSTTTHFADDHLAVVTESVQTPAQAEPKRWTTVRRKAAVVIAAMTGEKKFLLVRQERIPIRAAIWEMPAGQIDDAGAIEETVRRELREETGYELAADGELMPLGHYFSSPGFTDEHGYFFLARGVERVGASEDSILECRAFSAAELRDMIAQNEIRDANTLSMCARLAARGLFSFGAKE